MTRNYRARGMVLVLVAIAVTAVVSAPSTKAADEKAPVKPAITVVFPSTDEVFKDLKFTFGLVNDEKGFNTLKSTIELFLVGIETTQPGGIRIYPTAAGLQTVLSFPIKADPFKFDPNTGKPLAASEIKKRWPQLEKLSPDEAQAFRTAELKKLTPEHIQKLRDLEFGALILNLFDLDVKTAPAPTAALGKQIPKGIAAKLKDLHLAANERLIFGLADGFMRYESGYVHIGKLLPDVRLAKGGLPAELAEGHDLAALIDGQAQSQEERKTAFDKAKQELIGGIAKGEQEDEAVFEVRKVVTEHLIAEVERFFVESSRIHLGWNVSAAQKHARSELDIEGLPGTALEESVELLGKTPDEFASVSKLDTVFSLSGNFPIDPLRKAFLTNVVKLERALLKKQIAESTKHSDEQKKSEDELVELMFDVIDGFKDLGVINGFLRSWSNGDGTLTTVAGGRVPENSREKFEKMLEKLATRKATNKVENKVETESEVEIHKLSVPDVQTDFPEFLGKDGEVYVGTADKTLWLASGTGSLERLKKAIQESKVAVEKPGPEVELIVKLGPFVELRENYHVRNPAVAAVPANEPKKPSGAKPPQKGDKAAAKKVEGFISGAELRKIALETFKEGKDTMTFSLQRDNKTVKLNVQFDEGLIRFVGKLASKVVKENLEDD